MEQGPVDYFFAGAASLAEQLDKPMMAILRDGRHIIGTLVSYDHFGSLVLQNALERHFAGGLYCDLPMGGLYLVRGENLAMLGEIDPARDASNPLLRQAPWEEVRAKELEEEEKAKAAKAAAVAAAAATGGTAAAAAAAAAVTSAKNAWQMAE